MTRVEHVESAYVPHGDTIAAIVELSTEVRATSIAADARRVSERLEDARFFVAILGRPPSVAPIIEWVLGDIGIPLDGEHMTAVRFSRRPYAQVTFRDGSRRIVPLASGEQFARESVAAIEAFVDRPLLQSGVCVVIGPPSMRRWHRRVDLVLTSEADADEAERFCPGLTTITVDSTRLRDIDDAISLLCQLAAESGAARVETHADLHHRHLCIRIGNHLFEQHRALVRSQAASLARINSLTIARVLAESVFEERTRRTDTAREALASWLAIERTKFLMGTKADALMALDERLEQTVHPRHQLRAAAANASHPIAVELLGSFWRRTAAGAERPIAALSRALLTDLDASLGDLGENLSPQALTGFDLPPIRGLRRDLEWPAPGIVAQIVDRVGLASRRRIESEARDDLVSTLTHGSRRVIDRVLFDYDEANREIERRFCELLDSALQSARVAADLAQHAQSEGEDGIARARHRIAQWSIALDGIMSRLD